MKRTKFDTFLAILYAPMCLFSLLMHMATEAVLIFEDPIRIALGYFVGYSGPIIGFAAYPCLFRSFTLRSKGQTHAANLLRIAPLLAFLGVNLIEQIVLSII